MEILSNMETYTFYIDESGDSNTTKVRTERTSGATPYMVLGGALVKDKDNELIKSELEYIKKTINKSLHCAQLNHRQTRYFAKSITSLDVVLFGLISNKATLDNYGRNSKQYYHKCLQYILELLGFYMEKKNIKAEQVKIVIENSNSIDLSSFKNLIRRCIENPIYPETKVLKLIDPDKITVENKSEELLQLADLVAYSLFQCVDDKKSNYGIFETSYLNDLKNKFYHCGEDNNIFPQGIKPVHSIHSLKLSDDVKNFFMSLKNE
jgi:hypothetical protein